MGTMRDVGLSSVRDRFYVHDARQIGNLLSTDRPCIDLTATSPPYWNLKDYGVPNQIGFGQSKEEYLRDVESVLGAIFDITRETGSLWLVLDTYRERAVLRLLPFELAQVAEEVGWRPREIIIWDKQHAVPWVQKGQLRNVVEYILVFSKTRDYKYYLDRIRMIDELSKWWVDFPERFHPKGKAPSNVWHFPIRTQGAWNPNARLRHVCPFPTALAARIIEVATDRGDTVLDPFAGSGVMLAQAEAMNRHFIGMDINPEYARDFETTVREEVRAEWEELEGRRRRSSAAQVDFERAIMRLRALKYTRKVANAFLEALGSTPGGDCVVRAIICLADIPRRYVRGRPIEVTILIVMDCDHPRMEAAIAKAEKRRHSAPLSHFGIKARLELSSSDQAMGRVGRRRRLYLYPRQKPRKHYGRASVAKWLADDRLEAEDSGSAPILANFGVDVAWVLKD